ncbi:MAG: phosphohistidine phosphatase SixA [Desulfobulbaceae bacterium]|nr:phosphohistidine phosphatase SixA [Desulfobulbaceae bacterium]
MKVLLVQHGEAKSSDEDPARPLSEEGFRKTEKIAAWIGKHSFSVAEIQHSGKKRAEETAMIFAGHLSPENGIFSAAGLNPNDDVVSFAERLNQRVEPVMIVGHLPFLGKLAGLLLAGDPQRNVISFTNSGVVCLEKKNDAWSAAWIIIPGLLAE